MTTKSQVCRTCKEDKSLEEFQVDSRTSNNRRTDCRQCRNFHKRISSISASQRENLLKKQNNACAICGITTVENQRQLSVDHNHDTHQVRGLLCTNCNVGLGNFKDNITHLALAIEYLVKYEDTA